MGYVRKKTGIQAQIDAGQANAAAQEASIQQAAKAQQQAMMDTAVAAARQQSAIAARSAAEAKAADAAAAPIETADVVLDEPVPTVARKAKRARFGTGYNSGISV